jgi:hypothetical protein
MLRLLIHVESSALTLQRVYTNVHARSDRGADLTLLDPEDGVGLFRGNVCIHPPIILHRVTIHTRAISIT